jgi:hypothetical protein
LVVQAANQKANNKIIGTNLLDFTYRKTTLFGDPCNDRFVKELLKVFFTLLLEKRFVDIVKCD